MNSPEIVRLSSGQEGLVVDPAEIINGVKKLIAAVGIFGLFIVAQREASKTKGSAGDILISTDEAFAQLFGNVLEGAVALKAAMMAVDKAAHDATCPCMNKEVGHA